MLQVNIVSCDCFPEFLKNSQFKSLVSKRVFTYEGTPEENLEVKLLTVWSDEAQRWEEPEMKVRRESLGREEEKKNDQRTESQKKKNAGTRKGRKTTKHCVFFSSFVAAEGRTVGSLKQWVRNHLAR